MGYLALRLRRPPPETRTGHEPSRTAHGLGHGTFAGMDDDSDCATVAGPERGLHFDVGPEWRIRKPIKSLGQYMVVHLRGDAVFWLRDEEALLAFVLRDDGSTRAEPFRAAWRESVTRIVH